MVCESPNALNRWSTKFKFKNNNRVCVYEGYFAFFISKKIYAIGIYKIISFYRTNL